MFHLFTWLKFKTIPAGDLHILDRLIVGQQIVEVLAIARTPESVIIDYVPEKDPLQKVKTISIKNDLHITVPR